MDADMPLAVDGEEPITPVVDVVDFPRVLD
jgi:hypothetical protein